MREFVEKQLSQCLIRVMKTKLRKWIEIMNVKGEFWGKSIKNKDIWESKNAKRAYKHHY